MEHVKDIINKFQIPIKKYSYEPISNGLINDTYLVSSDRNPLYILQKINTEVFQNTEALFQNLDLVLPSLDASNYQKVELLATNTGKNYYKTASKEVWRLMTYIKDSQVFNTTENVNIAFEAGKIITNFHSLLVDFDIHLLADTLPNFHNLQFRHEQFLTALKNAKTEKIKEAKKAIRFVEENITVFLEMPMDNLPVRVCHNDTKLNNILFSKHNKALCLIDLDTLMRGSFLYDFGDAARTIVNTAREDEIELDKINFNQHLFESFISGIAIHSQFLTVKEKELLPLSVGLMPFLHGIRALTDYLENNKYYKVKYANQNLDRCKSLFAFSKIALENQTFMLNYIREKLDKF